MFSKPSLITRIAIGKLVGFIIGLIGFLVLPYIMSDVDLGLRWGVWLWYTTLGAIIGVFGVMTWHPVLKLPMPWFVRAPLLGAWMNFVLTLIAFDTLDTVMLAVFGADGPMRTPYWFVFEGAVVGLVIGYFATRFGGEGSETVASERV